MQVRRCLGYVYLHSEQRNATAALQLFLADLDTYVNNSRSLLGASQSLRLLGRESEAERMLAWADQAWRHADVPLNTTCPQLA